MSSFFLYASWACCFLFGLTFKVPWLFLAVCLFLAYLIADREG